MLEGWVTDDASWPKNRTLEMFKEWFEALMGSIVEDLYLGEALEYLELGRSLRVEDLNAYRPSFRIGRDGHH